MRAAVMTATGDASVLQLQDVATPELASPRDVRVRVLAAGINPVDYKLRTRGPFTGAPPLILGWDAAGVVESVGSEVTRFGLGDEVYFCDGGFGAAQGTYAEFKVIQERYVAHKPAALTFAEAAAAPLVTITAWEALRERARIVPAQFVLVHGGAGGVGHLAIQIAALAGARVATTTSTAAKAELARDLGAELAIDYRNDDVAQAVRAWTGGAGADVVHDTVGGAAFAASFELVRPYGDIVSNLEPVWADGLVRTMNRRNLRVSFTFMPAPALFGWPEERERQRRILDSAATLFDDERLRVHVGATFPLERVADAHRALEAGHITGKAVLTLD